MTFTQFEKKLDASYGLFWRHIKKEAIKSSLRMEALAKKNATKYPKVVTGRLRASIQGRVQTESGELQIFVRAGGESSGNLLRRKNYQTGKFYQSKKPASSSALYAQFVEFGTSKMDPRLYLGRAVETERPKLEKMLSRALKTSIRTA